MEFKKSLGQNFFNNPTLADKIVSYVKANEFSSIVEIGPGSGYFTSRLQAIISTEENLVLIEKDADLITPLKQKFSKITVYNEDFMDFDLNILKDIPKPIICFGALPYNISKRIIQKCVQVGAFSKMFFIIQKEVAYDYVNHDKKSSVLSIMNQIYADTKLLMVIKPGAFIPQPKVDSALIQITNHNLPVSNEQDLMRLERVIKQAFTNPRKTLKNNLKTYWNSKLDKYQSLRPEVLNLNDFLEISKQIDV